MEQMYGPPPFRKRKVKLESWCISFCVRARFRNGCGNCKAVERNLVDAVLEAATPVAERQQQPGTLGRWNWNRYDTRHLAARRYDAVAPENRLLEHGPQAVADLEFRLRKDEQSNQPVPLPDKA
jgi:hypothetical protein